MARINGTLALRGLGLLVGVFLLAACASHQGRLAYEAAEKLEAEQQFDRAVEKYTEATQLEPSSKTYQLKLIAARSRAAVSHIVQARELGQEGRVEEALEQYRLARELDPSIDIAAFEESQLLKRLEAEQLADEGLAFYQDNQFAEARRVAMRAMQVDPDNARVKNLMSLLDKERQIVDMDGVELDVASSEPLTLRFKNAKIKEVFNVLTKLTGINFIMDQDIRDQPISVFLEKASFAQSMELILQMNGLEKKVLNSKTIIIYPLSRDKDKQYGDQIIQTFYLSHIDAKKAVNLLRTMLQLRKVYVHEERNALVIRDKPEVIRLAGQILEATDRGDSEVVFELELLEINHSDVMNLGARLKTYGTDFGYVTPGSTTISDNITVGSTSNLEFLYTIPSANFSLQQVLIDSEILANPKIRVKNGGKAKVHVGSREPVATTTISGDQTATNFQYVDVGVKLDMEASIHLDDTVLTKIRVEVSSKTGEVTSGDSKAFIISTTNADTELVLKDGEMTILGGLIRDDYSKTKTTIPFLGKIPLLGDLISGHDRDMKKREILLAITPHIVKSIDLPNPDVATIWSGGEDNLKAGPNFGAFARPLQSEVDMVRPAAAPSLKTEPFPEPAIEDFLPEIDEPGPFDSDDSAGLGPGPAAGMSGPLQEGAEIPPDPALATDAQIAIPAAVVVDEAEAAAGMTTSPAGEGVPQAGGLVADPTGGMLFLSGPRDADVGQEFALTVEVAGVSSLYSAPLFVNYDPVRLSLLEIEEGSFLDAEGQTAVFSSNLKKDAGQIIVGYKQENGGQGASGSGSLFTMRFRAQAAGSALVDLNRINFRDPQGGRLMVEPAAVRIEIH